MQPAIVLCLDDEMVLLYLLETTLSRKGYTVLTAASAADALKLAAAHQLDAAILDYHVPDMNGAAVARKIRSIRPEAKIVMFSWAGDIPSSDLACVDALVEKGESVNALLGTLHRLLHRSGSEPVVTRRFSRHSAQLSLSVVTERSGELKVLQGISKTISAGGLGGTINGNLTPGEVVLLHISGQTGVKVETRRAQVRYHNADCYGFAFL